MRVAYDVTPATAGATGVARYVRELDAALGAAGADLRRFAFGRGPHPAPAGTRRLRVPLRVLRRTWRVVALPRVEHLTGPVDVVHVTDLAPPPTRRPVVMTVHDLDAVDRPDLHAPEATALQRAQLAAARDRADAVIADSATTAAALRAHGVDDDRLTTVPLGLTALPPPDPARVPAGPYLLAVGSLDARKGLDVLLAAFGRARLGGTRLVVAGPDGHRVAEVRRAVEATGAADRIDLPGRVTDAELAGLYAGALAFCFPSRAEGFGFPVLEAMAAGAPVLASDLPVVREVAGDVPLAYVPVEDVDGWVAALEAALAVDDATRAATAPAARALAARFTWEATAAATVAVYERVAGQPGRRS